MITLIRRGRRGGGQQHTAINSRASNYSRISHAKRSSKSCYNKLSKTLHTQDGDFEKLTRFASQGDLMRENVLNTWSPEEGFRLSKYSHLQRATRKEFTNTTLSQHHMPWRNGLKGKQREDLTYKYFVKQARTYNPESHSLQTTPFYWINPDMPPLSLRVTSSPYYTRKSQSKTRQKHASTLP